MAFIHFKIVFTATVFTGLIHCGTIKIVDEPFLFYNHGMGSMRRSEQAAEMVLVSQVKPERPTGPSYLINNLAGRCFSNMLNNYKYELCPFANVTQHEQNYRWNAFHGILGIWKEWIIENNTFTFMHMTNGDMCAGSLDRETKVNLTCGETNKILSVKEPSMCKYEMNFQTPYACPEDIFYVYPMLTAEGQTRWRNIEQAYIDNEITLKGYLNSRKSLFIDEGLLIDQSSASQKDKETTVSTTTNKPTTQNNTYIKKTFESVADCNEEYHKLLLEIERLHITIANLTAKSTNNETEKSPVMLLSVSAQQKNLNYKNESKNGDEGSVHSIIN